MKNRDAFLEAYKVNLRASVLAKPHHYAYSIDEVDFVSEKVVDALEAGTAHIKTDAIKSTCTELGVKHTIRDIKSYLKGE